MCASLSAGAQSAFGVWLGLIAQHQVVYGYAAAAGECAVGLVLQGVSKLHVLVDTPTSCIASNFRGINRAWARVHVRLCESNMVHVVYCTNA